MKSTNDFQRSNPEMVTIFRAEYVMYFAAYPENEQVWGRVGGHIFCYG